MIRRLAVLFGQAAKVTRNLSESHRRSFSGVVRRTATNCKRSAKVSSDTHCTADQAEHSVCRRTSRCRQGLRFVVELFIFYCVLPCVDYTDTVTHERCCVGHDKRDSGRKARVTLSNSTGKLCTFVWGCRFPFLQSPVAGEACSAN